MLPSLAVLGKSFWSEVVKVSKIVLFDNGKTVNLLKDDLQTRPRSWHLEMNEVKERITTVTAERYVKAII